MSHYKEIRQWLYLNFTTGEILFNISYALAIINETPETTLFPQRETRALSYNRFRKILKKAKAEITLIPINEIDFIKDSSGNTIDHYSASLDDNLEALSSDSLLKVISYEKQKHYQTQNGNSYNYEYRTFGEITRKSDGKLFISIDKTAYDIEGRGYFTGNMVPPSLSGLVPSTDVLRRRAIELANEDELIKISPTEIDFNGRVDRPKSSSVYISRSLHDRLYNRYITGKKYDLSSRRKSIDELANSIPSLSEYGRPVQGEQTLSLSDIESYNKQIRRIIKKISEIANNNIIQAQNSESHIRHELIETQRRLAKIREIVDSDDSLTFNQIYQIQDLTNQY